MCVGAIRCQLIYQILRKPAILVTTKLGNPSVFDDSRTLCNLQRTRYLDLTLNDEVFEYLLYCQFNPWNFLLNPCVGPTETILGFNT